MAGIAPESSSSRMLRMTSCWRLPRESPSKSAETCVLTTQCVLKPSKVPWQNTHTLAPCVRAASLTHTKGALGHVRHARKWLYLKTLSSSQIVA